MNGAWRRRRQVATALALAGVDPLGAVRAQVKQRRICHRVVDNDVRPLETLDPVHRRERDAVRLGGCRQHPLQPGVERCGVRVLAPEGDETAQAVRVRRTVAALMRCIERRERPIETDLATDEFDQRR